MKQRLNYNKWGIKRPLFQIDNKFKTSARTPDGYYELTFADADNIDAFVCYVDPNHTNYNEWKAICEDDDNLYVISNLVQKTKYNKPLTTRDGWNIINADSDPVIEDKDTVDKMRRTIHEYITQQPEKTTEANNGLFEYV